MANMIWRLSGPFSNLKACITPTFCLSNLPLWGWQPQPSRGHLFQCLAHWQQATSSYCLPQISLVDVSTSYLPWACSLGSHPHRFYTSASTLTNPSSFRFLRAGVLIIFVTPPWTVSTWCTSFFTGVSKVEHKHFSWTLLIWHHFTDFALFYGWYIPKCLPFSNGVTTR